MADNQDTSTAEAIKALAERLTEHQVFGTPVQHGSATLVPAADVRAGGGLGGRARRGPDQANGGAGFVAKPVGAWAITENGTVTWHPAVNVTRFIQSGQVALTVLVVGTVWAATRRRRRR